MEEADRDSVLEMMSVFYASEAVSTNGSEEIFQADIDECIGESPYAEGYVFESNKKIIGYGMLAKSYSTEFGRRCIWIEDIYLKESFRGRGIGAHFFDFVFRKYPDHVYRLEVEEENTRAVRLYEKCGFTVLPYVEMKK
jgi:ribosomal protein S18 acetylase RimI-like enzyme